jgi:Flp pilus assembly protein protease CpaA
VECDVSIPLPSYPIALALLGTATPFTTDGTHRLERAALTAVAVLVVYAVLALASRGAIGWGDVKLSGVLALYLGWNSPRASLFGVVGAFLLAAIVMLIGRRADRKTDLPVRSCSQRHCSPSCSSSCRFPFLVSLSHFWCPLSGPSGT